MSLTRLRRPAVFAITVACSAACSQINTFPASDDTLVRTQRVEGPGHDLQLHGTVSESARGFTVSVTQEETCAVHFDRVLHRTTTLHRSIANKSTLWLEYGLGAAVLIAGGVVAYDAQNVPPADDPAQTNPIGRTGAYGIGGGLLALGITGVVAGVIDSRRARDSIQDDGIVTEPASSPSQEAPCHRAAARDIPITLKPSAADNVIKLGSTDHDGRLVVPWSSIPDGWLSRQEWVHDATVITGDTLLGRLPLTAARTLVADRDWSNAKATNTSAGYRTFVENFPEAHHDEAMHALRDVRVPELNGDLTDALRAKDLDRAEADVVEWKALDPNDARLADFSAKVTALKFDGLLKDAEAHLAAARIDHGDEIGAASDDLDKATALAPDGNARLERSKKHLASVKSKIVSQLLARARSKTAKADFQGARDALEQAGQLEPDSTAIAKASQADQDAAERADRAEQRRLDRVEGPYWHVAWKCFGNVNTITLAERDIRAHSANSALKAFCKEGCDGYQDFPNDPRLPECARNCMSLVAPAPDSAIEDCMRIVVQQDPP